MSEHTTSEQTVSTEPATTPLCGGGPPVDPAVKAAIDDWNRQYPSNTFVQYRTDDGDDWSGTGFTWTGAFVQNGTATVRLHAARATWVPLHRVRVHPLNDRLAAMKKADAEGLEIPYPPCPYCLVDTSHDGEELYCPYCRASWSSGTFTHGRRSCVECANNRADVVGDDQQPRCLPCAAGVLTGEEDPTGPYRCRNRCSSEVYGIGHEHRDDNGRSIRSRGLCPLCCSNDDLRTSTDRTLADLRAGGR